MLYNKTKKFSSKTIRQITLCDKIKNIKLVEKNKKIAFLYISNPPNLFYLTKTYFYFTHKFLNYILYMCMYYNFLLYLHYLN